jgi:tRNA (guanine-N7-)-methyltransferase
MNYIRTYGRIRCRSFNKSIMIDNKFLYKNFDIQKINTIKNKNLTLEIGFGNGEVLFHRSNLKNQQINIGVDVYENGICKILKKIDINHNENIIIFNMDGRDFLLNAIKEKIFFKEIYILFPDPWHKKSEKKREKKRLINENFLKNIKDILQQDGSLYFATDHLDYYNNVKNILLQLNLSIQKETVNEYINENFTLSNYEKKATNDRYYLLCTKN